MKNTPHEVDARGCYVCARYFAAEQREALLRSGPGLADFRAILAFAALDASRSPLARFLAGAEAAPPAGATTEVLRGGADGSGAEASGASAAAAVASQNMRSAVRGCLLEAWGELCRVRDDDLRVRVQTGLSGSVTASRVLLST